MQWYLKLSRGEKLYIDSEEEAKKIMEIIIDPNCGEFLEYAGQMIKRTHVMGVFSEEEVKPTGPYGKTQEQYDKTNQMTEDNRIRIADFLELTPQEKTDKFFRNWVPIHWWCNIYPKTFEVPEKETKEIKAILLKFFTEHPGETHASKTLYSYILPHR